MLRIHGSHIVLYKRKEKEKKRRIKEEKKKMKGIGIRVCAKEIRLQKLERIKQYI